MRNLTESARALRDLLSQRILVLDGAMGTMLQQRHLTADDFGGAALEGCNENLVRTRPDVVLDIHRKYFDAGSDIIEPNSFGGAPIVLAEYGLAADAHWLNRRSAELARQAAGEFAPSAQPRFVARFMGPPTPPAPTPAHPSSRAKPPMSSPRPPSRASSPAPWAPPPRPSPLPAASPSNSFAKPTTSRPRAWWRAASTSSLSKPVKTRATLKPPCSPLHGCPAKSALRFPSSSPSPSSLWAPCSPDKPSKPCGPRCALPSLSALA